MQNCNASHKNILLQNMKLSHLNIKQPLHTTLRLKPNMCWCGSLAKELAKQQSTKSIQYSSLTFFRLVNCGGIIDKKDHCRIRIRKYISFLSKLQIFTRNIQMPKHFYRIFFLIYLEVPSSGSCMSFRETILICKSSSTDMVQVASFRQLSNLPQKKRICDLNF